MKLRARTALYPAMLVVLFASFPAFGQWLQYRTAGLPRDAKGEPISDCD